MNTFTKTITLLSTLGLALVGANITTAQADTNATTNNKLPESFLKTLKQLDANVENVLYQSPVYTLVSTDSGLITFIGSDGKIVFPDSPFVYDDKTNQFSKLKYKLLIDKIKPYTSKLITITPKQVKTHIYMIDNIDCPHCQQALHDYQKFLDAGYSVTYIPYVTNPEQSAKVSYILGLPADKRFKAFLVSSDKMPKADKTIDFLPGLTTTLFNYGVTSYPVFLNEDGVALEGYKDVKTINQVFQNTKK